MGLTEKREVKRMTDELLQPAQQKIKEIARTDIAVDVEWDGIEDSLEALKNVERTLDQLPQVFKNICIDDIGLRAIKVVKSIKLKNSETESNLTLAGGTFYVVNWWKNSFWDEESLTSALEEAL